LAFDRPLCFGAGCGIMEQTKEKERNVMRVCLFTLNASYSHSSLSLRCLAVALEREGFAVTLCERSLKDKRRGVLEALHKAKADVYGFSCYVWNVSEMMAMAEQLRLLRPDATIVFGGPEVSYETEAFFSACPAADLILAGAGEESLPKLCHALAERGREAVMAEGRILIAEPYYGFGGQGVPYERYPSDKPMVYYESSRGCPYACAYCLSAAERGVTAKPAGQVLKELTVFESMPSVKTVKFVDRTFNFDRDRAIAIWQGLRSEIYTKTYHFEICADLIDEDSLACLAQFPKGKVQLEAGVQSIHADTLMAIHRKPDVTRCLDNLRKLKDLGNIHIHADLIAGLPLETLEGVGESFDAVYPCCHMLQLGFLKLLKGSPLQEKAIDYGIVASPIAPYEVLKTDALSFEDLTVLHRIDEVLDRFGNSGHFSRVLAGVMERIRSPFDFFRSLSEAADDVGRLSQLDAMRLLLSVCRPLFEGNEQELIGRMRLDYYTHEAGSCPDFLAGGGELPVAPIRRADCIKKASVHGGTETCEVHRFAFDEEGYYVIDRKRHVCFRVTPSL